MVLLFSCLFIGLSAMLISTYYSLQWFLKTGMPWPIAVALALIYVGFANLIFEFSMERFKAGSLLRQKPKTRGKGIVYGFTAALIFLVWGFFAGFSIYSSIGGQYDQLINIEESMELVPEDMTDYTRLVNIKENSLEGLRAEENLLLDNMGSVNTVEMSWAQREALSRAQIRIEEVREEMRVVNNDLLELYPLLDAQEYKESFDITDRGFFTYVGDLTGWNPVMVQFWSALFPSIVIDIVSPICLSIFVIGWRREQEERKKARLAEITRRAKKKAEAERTPPQRNRNNAAFLAVNN